LENRALRRIFGPQMDQVTEEWRKLHNEELRDMYSSRSVIRVIKSRRMRWAGHLQECGEKRNAYRLMVGKPEGKRPIGRPRRKWVDYIEMDLREIECGVVDCIGVVQDRDKWRVPVNAVMKVRGPMKCCGVPWVPAQLLVSRVMLSSTDLLS
jgi:hypothetical protein